MPTLSSIQVSPGGVPKLPVERARVTTLGVEGDSQNNTIHHGGPDRAVCLFSAERIEALASEGHPIEAGSTGENLTVRGLDWPSIVPGTRLRVGPACVLEVTKYTTPCKTIAGSFAGGEFSRMLQTTHPGWSRVYARVLAEGEVKAGDTVEVVAGSA
jgi:MOSC domain-containing protein YiiM